MKKVNTTRHTNGWRSMLIKVAAPDSKSTTPKSILDIDVISAYRPSNALTFYMQTPGLNIITEYIMGLIYPGKPIANVCFKVYGYMSMSQAVSFLSDFKLGHYMKIPPRSMFLVQVHNVLPTNMTSTIYKLRACM